MKILQISPAPEGTILLSNNRKVPVLCFALCEQEVGFSKIYPCIAGTEHGIQVYTGDTGKVVL